ncbi:MAG TPA: hypothetical protein VHT91_43680 [Kofleriaceae bacterium]|nr:hypothetical protein [Kofleriaceae bacterium]
MFVVSERWLQRDWTRYELGRFAQGAPDRRRVAVLRSPRGTQELGPHLSLLQNVEWTDGTRDEAACAWQLVCGLTGEKPGPAATWSQQGSKYLGRIAAAAAPEQLAEPRPAGPRRPTELRDRDGVHLSCDRAEQWNSLTEIVRHRRNQLILLSGPRGEAHDEFLRRIEAYLQLDRPRRIARVTWTQYPCPHQPELLLADLAQALEVDEAGLGPALRTELARRDVVVLHQTAHCFDSPALLDYLTGTLPGCLREAGGAAFALTVVQPVEWAIESLPNRIGGWFARLVAGAPGSPADAAADFLDRIAERAAPELPALRLPELGRIEERHLEAFCEDNRLPRAQRAAFIHDVLHGARSSRDVLFNIQRLFPTMELT